MFIIDKPLSFVMIFLKIAQKKQRMTTEFTNYSNILIELNKAVKMHNFYPEGHPHLDSALEKCFLLLKKCLDERGEIKWKIDQKGFYDNRTLIPASNDIAGLAKKAFFRRIREITFTQRLTPRDVNTLISVFKLEPEEIQAMGGVEAIFAEKDIYGILLNELRYEDLKKLKKELEERKEQEKEIAAEKAEEAQSGKAPENGQEEKPEEHKAYEEEPLSVLLEKIKNETDFLRYNDLSVRIKERADPLLIERKFDELFQAAHIFFSHSLRSSGLQEDIRTAANERFHSFISLDFVKYLASRAGNKDEQSRAVVQGMLLACGDEAVEMLLDAITAAPEAVTRRNLYNTLVLFGKRIRPQVEKRLSSPEWFVIRQMISILGDLGDEEAIGALEAAYAHPDMRVRKEVLKSLVKIPSPRSTGIIIRTLDDENDALVNQAIISLGMLKDRTAIDVLGKLAMKKERFADRQDTRKEAVKALGNIGDDRAVPYLSDLLFKRVWFGRKAHEEIRLLAAYSLGMIGSDEANEVLKKGRDSSEEISRACKRILDRKEKKHERN